MSCVVLPVSGLNISRVYVVILRRRHDDETTSSRDTSLVTHVPSDMMSARQSGYAHVATVAGHSDSGLVSVQWVCFQLMSVNISFTIPTHSLLHVFTCNV